MAWRKDQGYFPGRRQWQQVRKPWNQEDGQKYGNRKTEVDGIEFDSRKEAARYLELALLQRAGEIKNLRRQVKFILIPAQHEAPDPAAKKPKPGKLIERECAYFADFVYEDREGTTVVEDTKGLRTKEYIIKRKLMLERFGIRIREV